MGFLESLPQRARDVRGHVVLVEGFDARIVEAAKTLREQDICRVTALEDCGGLGGSMARRRSLVSCVAACPQTRASNC